MISLIVLLPLMFGLMGSQSVPLVDPAPIVLCAKLSDVQIAKAVRQALLNRNWTVKLDAPGHILATLMLRKHAANIDIHWTALEIKISYVSSSSLKFNQNMGERHMHNNNLSWIDSLVSDINSNPILLSELAVKTVR